MAKVKYRIVGEVEVPEGTTMEEIARQAIEELYLGKNGSVEFTAFIGDGGTDNE